MALARASDACRTEVSRMREHECLYRTIGDTLAERVRYICRPSHRIDCPIYSHSVKWKAMRYAN